MGNQDRFSVLEGCGVRDQECTSTGGTWTVYHPHVIRIHDGDVDLCRESRNDVRRDRLDGVV